MIEILPGDIARGIQLVGLDISEGHRVPSRALLAERMAQTQGPLRLRALWLETGPPAPVPVGALRDLVSEGLPATSPPRRGAPVSSRCPICGEDAPSRVLAQDRGPVCPRHFADLWLRQCLAGLPASLPGSCPACGNATPLLWKEEGGERCTDCLAAALLQTDMPAHWILRGGTPLPEGALGDLRVFLEAWKRVPACERCGSQGIRIRKILVDFPRARGPLYPLWEIRRDDRSVESEKRRRRQLQAYTEGVLGVTLECPQCGYLEREFPGVDLSREADTPWPLSPPPFAL